MSQDLIELNWILIKFIFIVFYFISVSYKKYYIKTYMM